MNRRQELELLGWRAELDNTNAWNTARPFMNWRIIQPDGNPYEIFNPDGTPFVDIMSEDEAWDLIFDADDFEGIDPA